MRGCRGSVCSRRRGGRTSGGSGVVAVERLHQSMAELWELSVITGKAMTIVDTITTGIVVVVVVTATSVVGATTATVIS